MKQNKINKYQKISDKMVKIFDIFEASEGTLRPHFILTGPSGSGKSWTIKQICDIKKLNYIEVNAAALTKEGMSGNSLSKALSPLNEAGTRLTVVFVDEFDKLFISGNSNDSKAHESTTGVQNEFLKVLEGDSTQVFGDYGKYVTVKTSKVLFIFAGAFNNEDNINLQRLQDIGLKTEFLGRVGLVFNIEKLSLNAMLEMVKDSNELKMYCELYNTKHAKVVNDIQEAVKDTYKENQIGARLISSLVTQYFINGGELSNNVVKNIEFKNKLEL